MLTGELIPILNDQGPLNIISDPYMEVIVNAKDRTNIQYTDLLTWDRSTTCNTKLWQGYTYIGLPKDGNTGATVDLTKTINLPKRGLYEIEIIAYIGPQAGVFQLYDGTAKIEGLQSTQSQWEAYRRFRYHVRTFSSGNHNFKLSLSYNTSVVGMSITPINQLKGNSNEKTRDSNTRLDIQTCEFTGNNISDINTLDLKVAMKDAYWKPDSPDSGMIFEFTDSVTILVGEDPNSVIPKFGGYILGPNLDKGVLQLSGVDRLMDLQRQPLYHNFSIGTAPTSDDVKTLPYIEFPNVSTLSRYLSETAEYYIATDEITQDYGFKLDLSNQAEYNSINCTGAFQKAWDPNWGNPKPSILIVINGTGTGQTFLFNSVQTYDAAVYNYLHFDYCITAVSLENPLPFNVIVTMHTAEETLADAKDYVIQFTGAGDQSNVIGSVKPILSGGWERFNVDLKAMFDSIHPSTEYNISKIRHEGVITQDMIDLNKCRSIWIDNPFSYKDEEHAPKYSSQDVKYPMEELQQLAEQTNHAIYTRPGVERCDDHLIVVPEENNVSEGYILEGENLLEISNWTYNPQQDGFCNQAHRSFNFSEDKSGESFYQNLESINKRGYGPWQNHQFLDSVTTQADADTDAKNYVVANSRPNKSFTAKIRGTTMIWPAQYIPVMSKSNRINGVNLIKAITSTFDMNADDRFTTSIDLNKPSKNYLSKQRALRRQLRNLGIRYSGSAFSQHGISKLGSDSPGAFV